MLSTIFGLLYMLSPGKFGANYYMCLGEDPSQDPYDHGKVRKNWHKIIFEKFSLWSFFPQ